MSLKVEITPKDPRDKEIYDLKKRIKTLETGLGESRADMVEVKSRLTELEPVAAK